ncbi:aldolase/citrate lyase family protein [Amnibacterium sp.]|uniref:HpcH/HpaI aldolase/citrate lyase family protein n=1 Tax=Amnibacterium sp. TaxID=1872496 RepID=UPI0026187A85|nr:aldolase/citrate lyase family protein [Amnibacterium sp.]MCU1474697.1 CoA ester lyase [Amnibacterium sp.]
MSGALGPALLFCPADRPDRYGKALAAADTVILDLEDAVAAHRKDAARAAVAASALPVARTVVRVNPVSAGMLEADLAAVDAAGYRTIMLAKAESTADLAPLGRYAVIALCETPAGVLAAPALAAAPNTVGLMWGAEDLVAALGGRSSRGADGRYRDVARAARAAVLLAAGASGRAAYDAVHLDLTDDIGLAAEAEDAAASGFAGTVCIHPRQVPVVRTAYQPTDAELAWAHRVLEAAAAGGVVAVDGRMVDEPLLVQARRVVAAAG